MNITSEPAVWVGGFVLSFEEAGARLDRAEASKSSNGSVARATGGPAPFALGRAAALEAARALRPGTGAGLAFVGPAGCGKSTVLALLAADPVLRERFDVFVRVRAAGQPWQDVLTQIFRALHPGGEPPQLPASNDWLEELRDRRVGLALDDADAPFELDRLLLALPGAIAFATARQPLAGLTTVRLAPLSERDASWLLASNPLVRGERDAVRELAKVSEGNPLRVKQLAALAANRPAAELSALLGSGAAFEPFLRDAAGRLDARQRGLLDAIGIFGAAAVESDDPGAAKLAAEGLVVPSAAGWRIAPELEPRYQTPEEFVFRSALNSCAPTLTGAVATERDPSRLAPVVAAARRAGELDRFGDVIDLGRTTGNALARCGAWNEWRAVLDLVSAAAGRTGADGVQSWVLHQSGTRLACLGQTADAQSMLRAALARRRAARDDVAARLSEHNLKTIGGGGSSARIVAGAVALATAAAVVFGATFALRPHGKVAVVERPAAIATAHVAKTEPVAPQQVAVQPVATSTTSATSAAPTPHPQKAKPAFHPLHKKPTPILAAVAVSTVAAAELPASAASAEPTLAPSPEATLAPTAAPAPSAQASPSPAPSARPSPKARATPRPRAVALVPKPATPPAHYTHPEILAFGATRTLLTTGASTRLCMNVRDATHVRLTATSQAQTREVPLPPAVHRGKPVCIRVAPKSATRYALHANSGPFQAFRILAVDVFAAPAQTPQTATSAAP